jgi:inorganic triphosphatase YgiF
LEIEAKFILPDEPTFRRLVEVLDLGGLRLGAAQVKHVRDRYLDTASGSFLRAGYACRVRSMGDMRLVTLKSIVAIAGVYHHREEIEVRLTPAQASGRVDHWPASQATSLARQVSEGQPLKLLFELQQERHVRLATRASEHRPVAEISIDSVRFDDNGASAGFELEAELLPAGQLADLDLLTAELIERWALLPQAESKFERGLALCCPQLGALLTAHKNSSRSLA